VQTQDGKKKKRRGLTELTLLGKQGYCRHNRTGQGGQVGLSSRPGKLDLGPGVEKKNSRKKN